MTDPTVDRERTAIDTVVKDYFLGMYEGDVARLEKIFNPQCWLFGENQNGHHEFPLSGFLEQIGKGPVPLVEGEPFEMRLVSVDREASIAVARAAVRYQNRHYTDLLTLQKTGAGWKIVNKAFYCAD